ncbi:UDP-N-acetylglucosamine 2-epimerase [uncultured delta proteobacterium]|uniref:UDP-N-acetylglucosamine 2-epimerase n=1 Tax=uncultured delta proteobacterium TaxID=34034 RepID=A0A212KGM8_9DELT|nr:UDP-N-acetylglucosamine 2-epimerase [uncultured delta proteobacterium]
MSTRIHIVVAARPNFMKAAPLWHALASKPWAKPILVHTGQHYDHGMSDVFFEELGMPEPNVNLGIGGGTHGMQTGRVLEAYESLLLENRPELVVVCGDVNATPAAALAAVKLGIPVAHLEAGLRSFDRTMPEEINRLITDTICDELWTPSEDADEHLLREGIPPERIQRVGNIMIDTLEMLRPRIESDATRTRLGLTDHEYAVVTVHRPSNVDDPRQLQRVCTAMFACSEVMPLIFPLHPRTRTRLADAGLLGVLKSHPRIFLAEPLPYIAFMNLIFGCAVVVTDSGGVQEETSYLGIPCLTLRENTERPITVTRGTNRLVTVDNVLSHFSSVPEAEPTSGAIPLWDGKTAGRIVDLIHAKWCPA